LLLIWLEYPNSANSAMFASKYVEVKGWEKLFSGWTRAVQKNKILENIILIK